MLSELLPRQVLAAFSVSGRRLGVISLCCAMISSMLMQLLGSVGAIKFMALTGNTGNSNSGDQQKETFHGRAM